MATPDDNEETFPGTDTVPLEERMHTASREQFVRPGLSTEVGDGQEEPGRDIADEGLVLGIDSLAINVVKGSKGSAEESPSSDLGPNFDIPPPPQQGQPVDQSRLYHENKELKEKVGRLEGNNEALRKEVSDLRSREQALSYRDWELELRKREQKHHFDIYKQKQELQLERERLEIQVKRSQSDLLAKQKELEIEREALEIREKRIQIEKQEHEQRIKNQEESHQANVRDLETRERNVRAERKALINQQERNEMHFQQRERDLQLRERSLEVMIQENRQLKERVKYLENENGRLHGEVDLLSNRIDILLQDDDNTCDGGLLSILTERHQLAGITNLLTLSKATGACGKQCIVCGIEESRCSRCERPRAEHCKDSQCNCLKEHHPFNRAPNSHAYAKGMLFRSCGRTEEEVIWDGTKEISKKPSTCYWHLLCRKCEQKVSAIEGRICERDDEGYYSDVPEGYIHQEDVTFFRVCTYRALPLNSNIFVFAGKLDPQKSQMFVRVLKTLHQAFDDAKQQGGQPDGRTRTIQSCEKGMLFLYGCSDEGHLIEFPILCEVDLTSVRLGHQWLVYGQMPPYYWAFPLNPDEASLLQRHFRSIIHTINSHLTQLHDEYYKQCPKANQKRDLLKLIVGYPRRLGKYCITSKDD